VSATAGVTKWPGPEAPTERAVRGSLSLENLRPYQWSNGPGDVYAPHCHTYEKVIYVLSGSITFGLVDLHAELHLGPGDRLDLPAGITHDARVGPHGVVCLEAHR
jgi:quercetin dioxygenase-like cupin family protein